MSDQLLSIDRLVVEYPRGRGRVQRAVDEVSFTVMPGQTVGLVGESGSGKSTIARAIVGLAPMTAGTARQLSAARRAASRRKVQMVFQDPYSSLDPTKTVGYSVAEPLRVHGTGVEPDAIRQRTRTCSRPWRSRPRRRSCTRAILGRTAAADRDRPSADRAAASWSSATRRFRPSISPSRPRSSTCWCGSARARASATCSSRTT